MLPHEIGYHDRGGTAYASVAMDKDPATRSERLIYEFMACGEVLFQVCRWCIEFGHPLVRVLLRKLWVEARADR